MKKYSKGCRRPFWKQFCYGRWKVVNEACETMLQVCPVIFTYGVLDTQFFYVSSAGTIIFLRRRL
jgi:hypothetical protein